MDKLKSFLIKRLILILIIVVTIELILNAIVNFAFFPLIQMLMGVSGSSALSITNIPYLIWGILTGNNAFIFGSFRTSAAVFLILLSIFLLTLPVIIGILTYATIVTKQVEILEKERDQERKDFEAQRNLMLSDFAHDLRTPIMTIGGYAAALNDGMIKNDAQKKEYLNAIASKSKRMTELITMLFEYVRVGSEGFTLNRKKIDLHAFLTEIIAGQYTDLEDAGIEVDIDIPEEPFYINADDLHLKRVIENLIINVIRHNPTGIKVRFATQKLSGVEYLAIADSGVTIQKSEDELFEPFVKGEESRSQNKGSGLGLSVAKQVMDMHGYEIHLKQPYGDYTKAFILKFVDN
jgi:signal transduction histidine kinase